MKYNICSDGEYKNNYKRHIMHVCASYHGFRNIHISNSLENVGQDHGVQQSQSCRLTANINICERHHYTFVLQLSMFSTYSDFTLLTWNSKSRSRSTTLQLCLSIANIQNQITPFTHFCVSSHHFNYINTWNYWHWKFKAILGNTTFAFTPCDRKRQFQ